MGITRTEYPYISPNGIVHSETSRNAEHVNAMEHDEVTPPRDDDDREFARDDDSLPTTELSAVPPPSSPPVPVLRAIITDDHVVRDRKGLLPIQKIKVFEGDEWRAGKEQRGDVRKSLEK